MTGMAAGAEIDYRGYSISITEGGGRFTPRVRFNGRMVEHDGRISEIWTSASCGSRERALEIARTAIDTGRVK